MRYLTVSGLIAVCMSNSALLARGGVVRTGPAEAAIAATVALPADAKLVYVLSLIHI